MTNPFEITYLQTTEQLLQAALINLLSNISHDQNCISIVFFGNTNLENFESDLFQIRQLVEVHFSSTPLVSFIPHPLCGEFTYGLEIIRLKNGQTPDCVIFKQFNDTRYATVELDWGKTIFVEGVNATCRRQGYSEQSSSVLDKTSAVLQLEGFGVQHIVRQWNYIGNITDFENGNQHYQLFNNARSSFYTQNGFTNNYPAATGISMPINCLSVSTIAILPSTKTAIMAIDNKLQTPAYKYSEAILVKGNNERLKTTPKFERGKLILADKNGIFFVSGTAAIRNETSSHINDAVLQTRETIENINYLISNENLRLNDVEANVNIKLSSIRIYIKNKASFPLIKTEVDTAWPYLQAIYLQAEVCRTELLVEIEGVAEVEKI